MISVRAGTSYWIIRKASARDGCTKFRIFLTLNCFSFVEAMTDIVLEKQSLLAQCFYLAFLWITAFGLNEKKCFLKILPITLLRKKLPLRKGSNIAVFRNAVAPWHLI